MLQGVYGHYEWHAILRQICNAASLISKQNLISLLDVAFMFTAVRINKILKSNFIISFNLITYVIMSPFHNRLIA